MKQNVWISQGGAVETCASLHCECVALPWGPSVGGEGVGESLNDRRTPCIGHIAAVRGRQRCTRVRGGTCTGVATGMLALPVLFLRASLKLNKTVKEVD